MRFAIHALKVRDGHVCVDLGAFDALVPQHFLHITDVRPIAQHVCRCCMAKGMAGAAFTDPGTTDVPPNKRRQLTFLDALAGYAQKERFTTDHCRQATSNLVQVLLNPVE